jgi:acyl-CoA dehydrogenase
MLSRANDPRKRPFGKLLSEHGVVLQRIAYSRLEIDAARLTVLNAASKIDEGNTKTALKEIAAAKVLVPQVTSRVIDRAIQSFGAEGVSQDTPLAAMWANARIVRIADGPDEVHLQQLGRSENKRGSRLLEVHQTQADRTDVLFAKYALSRPSSSRRRSNNPKI